MTSPKIVLVTNSELDAEVQTFDACQGERVIERVHRFLGRFVAYPSEHAHIAHTLWVLHTHMMSSWDSTPRLAFLSPEPGSGKTRALEVTALLVPNPVPTVNVSAPYLFRKVASEEGATILFDEIDTVFGPRAKDHEDIRGLLNAGHRRGATTGRCAFRGREIIFEEMPAYAAVALAGIGWLPDTLLSRSVVIRMRRRHPGEQIEAFRPRIHELEGYSIRDQIAVWASSASSEVKWPEMPPGIADRDADVWEALIMVADVLGGNWPVLAREAGGALVAESKDIEPSLGIRLLQDMKSVFSNHSEMTTKSILEALHGIEEAPWADLKGKPFDERGLASRLRQYGIKSKTIRVGGATPKGYARTDFVDIWARYLSAPTTSATSATSATRTADAQAGIVPDRRQAQQSETAVADVADVAPPEGTVPPGKETTV